MVDVYHPRAQRGKIAKGVVDKAAQADTIVVDISSTRITSSEMGGLLRQVQNEPGGRRISHIILIGRE